MKVPHQVSGLRPSGQPLSYLRSSVSPATFGAGKGQALARAGAAVAGLGSTVEAAAQVYEERQNKAKRFKAEREFTEFQSRVSEQLTELKRNSPPDAANFPEQAEALYANIENEFIGNRVPPELQDEFRVRTGQVRTGIVNDSLAFQYAQQDAFFEQGLNDEFIGAQISVAEDPTRLQDWNLRIDEMVETTDLSAAKKEELKRQFKAGLASIVYKEEVKAQGVALEGVGSHAMAAQLLREEEGFRTSPYWDVNALRTGYGSDTVTRADGTVEKVKKGTTVSREEAELDLARRLQEFQVTAVGQVGEAAWSALSPNVQAALLSVTYNYGELPANVANAVQTGDVVQIANAVRGLKSNPKRRRREAAVILGQANIDADPRFASVPYEDRLALRKDAEIEQRASLAAAERERKAEYDARLNTLLVGIHDGQMGQAHIDSWRERTPEADYDDIKKAQDALDKRDEDLKYLREGQEKLGSATAVFDPMDTDDKKRLNALFGEAGKARVSALDADYFTGAVVPIVEKTGDIPTDVVGLLQGMMRSNDQQRAVFALDALAQLEEADARAFAHRVPDAVASDVRLWRTRKDYYPRDELMKLINGGLSSQERQQREMLVKEAESLLKDLDPSEAIDVIEGIVLRSPGFGPRPHAERAFTLDYQNLFIEEYTRYGDEDEAQEAAIERLGRVWGVTEVGGKSTLMKYPPEKAGYRPVNGGYEWIDEQVRGELGLRETEGFQLIADDQTREEFSKGVPPSYRMLRVDENGVYSLPEDEEGLPVRMNFVIPQEYLESEAQRLQLSKQLSIYRDKYVEFSQAKAHSALTGVPIPDEIEGEMVAVREAIRELRPIIATHERGLDQELIRVLESIMTDTFLGAP